MTTEHGLLKRSKAIKCSHTGTNYVSGAFTFLKDRMSKSVCRLFYVMEDTLKGNREDKYMEKKVELMRLVPKGSKQYQYFFASYHKI